MISAPTYHFSLAAIYCMVSHACHAFKHFAISQFLFPTVGWLGCIEEKRREQPLPIIMYFFRNVFSPLSFSVALTNKTPAISQMAKNPDGFPC